MWFARALMAALIAWAVALAPVTGAFAAPAFAGAPGDPAPRHHAARAAPAPSADADHRHSGRALAVSHGEGSAADLGPPHGCCDENSDAPAQGPSGDCGAMPGCVLKCFSLLPFQAAEFSLRATAATRFAWPLPAATPPGLTTPPFHPPRS